MSNPTLINGFEDVINHIKKLEFENNELKEDLKEHKRLLYTWKLSRDLTETENKEQRIQIEVYKDESKILKEKNEKLKADLDTKEKERKGYEVEYEKLEVYKDELIEKVKDLQEKLTHAHNEARENKEAYEEIFEDHLNWVNRDK